MLTYALLFLAIGVPLIILVIVMVVRLLLVKLDKRRSPLTLKVVNLPGEGLRRRMTKHDEAYDEAVSMAMVSGLVVLASWLLWRMRISGIDWTRFGYGSGDLLFVGVLAVLLAWSSWKVLRSAAARSRCRQGLNAELAIAQCLLPVVADGGTVLHDFPADKFNIDHIVVGASAVFAIETKSRKKPGEKGKASTLVTYDGSRLHFPKHVETRPIEQAAAQARWLAKFLASGVGEPVRVVPVVALPGWYVEQKVQRPDVLVSNCHNPRFMMSASFGEPLGDVMRKRIAHVLLERYPHLAEERF